MSTPQRKLDPAAIAQASSGASRETSGQANPSSSRQKLLDAALHVIRAKGYAATTVDDICAARRRHQGQLLPPLQEQGRPRARRRRPLLAMAEGLFATAPYHQHADPLDRLLGYVDFRAAILTGELPDYTCLLGTLVQETYDTHPHIRAGRASATCQRTCRLHSCSDIEAAKQLYAPRRRWTAESVGYFIQSVLQGAFIFAKAQQSPEVAREAIDHLHRYLAMLFPRVPPAPPKRR